MLSLRNLLGRHSSPDQDLPAIIDFPACLSLPSYFLVGPGLDLEFDMVKKLQEEVAADCANKRLVRRGVLLDRRSMGAISLSSNFLWES